LRWAVLGISPDRQRVAVALRQGPTLVDVWSYDLARGGTTRLSMGAGSAIVNPTWAADGRQVFFSGFVGQRLWQIYRVSSGDTSTPQRLLPAADQTQWAVPCSVSEDGRWLLYTQGPVGQMDIWVAPLDGSATPRALMTTPVDETDAKFSPDGRSFVYISNETGRPELYLRAFPIDGERVQLTTGGAAFPAWSPDGREIFYRTPGAVMSVATARTAAGLQPSVPRQLFAIADPLIAEPFGVAADAQRFVFLRSGGSARVSVVLNWAAQVPDLARGRR
jgi:Tol biopolymer transport system component